MFKTPKGTELPLMNLKGKEYLQIAFRVIWFKEEKPDWSIETEIIEAVQDRCTVKATIKDESGKIRSTGHKMEHFKSFQDALEKAETGAIGRALALLGYGTQFAVDLDEGERIADSPVSSKKSLTDMAKEITGATVENPGEYRIPFGKTKGKTFAEVGERQVLSALQWVESNNKTPFYKDFIVQANEFLSKQNVVIPTSNEDIPF